METFEERVQRCFAIVTDPIVTPREAALHYIRFCRREIAIHRCLRLTRKIVKLTEQLNEDVDVFVMRQEFENRL